MSEFNILATETGDGETESRDALGGPSIVIMTKGRDKMKVGRKEHGLDEGYVFFIGMGEDITFKVSRGLQVFTAFVEQNALMV
jgi:mannose-6-phosphate isomerase